MSKKKRKRRSFVPESEAKEAVKKSFREFNWKLLGKLVLIFAAVFGIYQLFLKLAEIYGNRLLADVTVIVYIALTTILLVVFIIINKGVSNDIPTKEQLRDDWTDKQKQEYIDSLIESKKKARPLMLLIIPLVFTLLIDMIYLLFL